MRGWLLEAAAMLVLFLAVTALASLLGAANLGTAAAFGQIGFMLGLVFVLLRR
jgi:hypothetical protein